MRRRPRLQGTALAPGEVVTPAELERDAVAVLVGLIEWAASVGMAFEAALATARRREAQRVYGRG